MQPAMIIIAMMPNDHVHKSVVNTKSYIGTFIKGKDELPNLIIATTSQHDNSEEGSIQAMTRD